MATTGPMLVAELHISHTVGPSGPRRCSCGRESKLFYELWLGIGGDANRDEDTLICSFCAGERLTWEPNGLFGKKLMLQPNPNEFLTDDERADVRVATTPVDDLRRWALIFGTGALQHRIENGQEWEKLAEFQWAKVKADARLTVARSLYRGKFQFIERKDMRLVQVKARRTPTEREVGILKETRELWGELQPQVCADLDLVWVKPTGEAARTELQVAVWLPNGGVRRLFYALPQQEAS